MKNNITTTNQSAKLALSKSKSLLKVTNGILVNRDDKRLDFILDWAEKNIIQEKTNFPQN